ncbi:MAG: hypothetical protein JNL76_01085 [Alphaproteobacteria bacterium]|nr:hypothetical protein [Alphaproteobacteria bacterium]
MLGKNLEISQKILEALNELMALHVPSEDEYAGKPFVTCDRKRGLRFGVTTGKLRGGLYAIYHLLDSLEAASFFPGGREPNMDLDDMAHRVCLGSFKIYDGVVLSVTQGGMTLTIETGDTAENILNAIRYGIDARKERDLESQGRIEYREFLVSQWNKEKNAPYILHSVQDDEVFIKKYLQQVIANYLGSDTELSLTRRFHLTKWDMDWPECMGDDYPIKGKKDMRPIFEVSVEDRQRNWARFHTSGLRKKLSEIFVGVGGFFLSQGQRWSADIQFSVRGNPHRLVHDIFEGDPKLAGHIVDREKFRLIDPTPS